MCHPTLVSWWLDCYSCAGELSLLVQLCWRAFSLGSAVLESFLSWLCWRAFSLGSAVLESFLSWFSCAGELSLALGCAGELSLLVQLCWRAFSLGCAGELSLLVQLCWRAFSLGSAVKWPPNNFLKLRPTNAMVRVPLRPEVWFSYLCAESSVHVCIPCHGSYHGLIFIA